MSVDMIAECCLLQPIFPLLSSVVAASLANSCVLRPQGLARQEIPIREFDVQPKSIQTCQDTFACTHPLARAMARRQCPGPKFQVRKKPFHDGSRRDAPDTPLGVDARPNCYTGICPSRNENLPLNANRHSTGQSDLVAARFS